jgi:uncharacterized protein
MAASEAERIAVGFARLLRHCGLNAPLGSVITFLHALGQVGIDEQVAVYWAARSTLVHRPEDLPLFDRAFAVYWLSHVAGSEITEDDVQQITLAVDDGGEDNDGDGSSDGSDDPSLTLRFSAVEVLRDKDFAAYDDAELAIAQRLMSTLRFAGPPRHSFRMQRSRRPVTPDLLNTLRASMRAGGEPIRRHWRAPGDRLRRLVLVLDISGSMEPYARAMLRFVQAAVVGRQRVEAFAIGTRLTRITRELSSRDPDRSLRQASARVRDWSGGTRLGECLRQFNDEWGVRGMARGAIVVVLSDGWDRGDPDVLAEQMRRLHRVAYHVVWVNPLKVTPGYAPLARGMAAALPWVDSFVEGHSVAAMERLATVIAAPAGKELRHA